MSRTDQPPGSRPNCPVCGEHRWAFNGYCLGECAGPLDHPDYPISAPEELKWKNSSRTEQAVKKAPPKKKPPKPPKKGRRALELQYEAKGEIAPWLVEQKPEGS